ncbi:MAG: NAD(P)H-dependent oxidoreductase [Bacilli bacterium]|nr:NAD(P)H-dependent oxidoreductase [Bacilli bacterium]
MKIAIVVISYTGNTKQVSILLEEALKAASHEVTLIPLETIPNNPNVTMLTLKEVPSLEGYEGVILGSPVHGFMPSYAMKTFIKETPSFSGKIVFPYVTHAFPFAWMGGSGAVGTMKKQVLAKGGQVSLTQVINWGRKNRDVVVATMIQSCVQLFNNSKQDE